MWGHHRPAPEREQVFEADGNGHQNQHHPQDHCTQGFITGMAIGVFRIRTVLCQLAEDEG